MTTRKNWRQALVLRLLACTMMVALAACGKKTDTPKAEGDPQPASVTSATPTSPKDDKVTYTAEAFYTEGNKDKWFLTGKHAEKAVEVTGVVSYYGGGKTAGMVTLKGGPEVYNRVFLRVVGRQPWLKALPGQTATFRTKVPKTVSDPDDVEWEVVEAKGPSPSTVTAEQLVREQREDRKAADKKYFQQKIILTGTVAEVTQTERGDTKLLLEAGGKDTVTVILDSSDQAHSPLTPGQKKELKPGAKIKVLGGYLGEVSNAILLDPAP